MPPGEDPNKPKKRRSDPAEEVRAPSSDPMPITPEMKENWRLLQTAQNHIARYADEVARGIFGDLWDHPHSIIAFGTGQSQVVELLEQPADADARLIVSDLQEVADTLFMEAAALKRPLVCILSVSAAKGVRAPSRAALEEQRKLAHEGSDLIAFSRLDVGDLVGGRDAVIQLLDQVSQTNFRPACRWIADVAKVRWTTRPFQARSGPEQSWYLVDAIEATTLVREATAALEEPGAEFLLQLTSLPKECEPWLVGEKSQAERLHQALDDALSGLSIPAAEETLADISAPVDGVALARSVWQSLRTEMKGVIEARIRELSEQRFETYEEKAAVAAELHQAMVDWGFRAIAPATGQASFLRCKQTKKNPLGFFSFESISDAPVVAPIEADPPKTPSVLPPFRLTDRPPDRRRK